MSHSDCHKCAKCESDCGCGNDVLLTPNNCPSNLDCPNPEKCPETFSANCVVWTADTIADLGIIKGMKLSDAIQRLIGAIVNPGCNYPTDPCSSVVGFYSTNVAKTTASFKWGEVIGATGYQVEYRLTSSPSWLANPQTTNLYDTIGTLLANSDYYVRVKTICGVNVCYSLTLLIKTKSN